MPNLQYNENDRKHCVARRSHPCITGRWSPTSHGLPAYLRYPQKYSISRVLVCLDSFLDTNKTSISSWVADKVENVRPHS